MKHGDEEVRSRTADELADGCKRKIRKMIVRLRKYRGRLPLGFKFDREEANERR